MEENRFNRHYSEFVLMEEAGPGRFIHLYVIIIEIVHSEHKNVFFPLHFLYTACEKY